MKEERERISAEAAKVRAERERAARDRTRLRVEQERIEALSKELQRRSAEVQELAQVGSKELGVFDVVEAHSCVELTPIAN